MTRSKKKGVFVDLSVLKRVVKPASRAQDLSVAQSVAPQTLHTKSRRSHIIPEMVGHQFQIHNGQTYVSVRITENMVGRKLGEFARTRTNKRSKR